MPLACDLYPEFEYVGSAPRKLGLALAFVVAGVSGIAVFMAESGPDPMNAMALAPMEAVRSAIRATPMGTAETQEAEAALVQQPPKALGNKPPCQENNAKNLGGDCTPGKAHRPRSVQAVNEQPAIAAFPIGHVTHGHALWRIWRILAKRPNTGLAHLRQT